MKKLLPILALTVVAVGAQAITYTVTNNNDAGAGSLRQAIANANGNNGQDTVVFSATTNTTTIALTSAVINVTGNLVIIGNGTTNTIVSFSPTGGWYQAIDYTAGTFFKIEACKITHTAVSNGTIRNSATGATLEIDQCEFDGGSQNAAMIKQAAVGTLNVNHSYFHTGGNAAITVESNSTFNIKNNSFESVGVGVNQGSTTPQQGIIENNTFYDCGASGIFFSTGNLTVRNNTITNGDRGLFMQGGAWIIENNIIHGNVTDIFIAENNSPITITNTKNIVGNCTVYSGPACPTWYSSADPLLVAGVPQANGGLTRTIALQNVSSPAIDAAGTGTFPLLDQRGYPRVLTGMPDIGAFEYGSAPCNITGTDVISSGIPITWVDGNTYSASTSTPTHTFAAGAANGCDSVVTLNLTLILENTWDGSTSTAWNEGSNWSTGSVPLASDNVVIPNVTNDPVISNSATINDVELQLGATLGVASGGTLTLNGTLSNAGAVTIQSSGSFLQGGSSSITGAGTFSVQRQGGTTGINYWSSPITAQSGVPGTSYTYDSSASTQADNDDIPSDPGWSSYNGTMTPGKGYAGQGGGLATFTGTPNNGNVNHSLSYTPFDNTFTQTTPGTPFNLVGNPYPSAITANSFIAANDDIFGTIYFWIDDLSGGSDYNRTDYAYWNGSGGLGTSPGSQGMPNGNIASCQGFLVRVKDGATAPYDISFTNAMRVAGNNNQFLKTDGENSRLWFSVEGNENFDQILVALMQDATQDEDELYDAVKLNSPNSIAMSAESNGTGYAIMAVNPPAIEQTIALSIKMDEAGLYNFKAATMENLEGYDVYFNDVLNGTSVLLEEGVAIPVSLAAGEYNNRFYLNFVRTSLTGIEDEEARSKLSVYAANDVLHVLNAASATNATIELLDMSGRLVMSRVQTLSEGNNNIALNQLSTGVYVVRITTATETRQVKILKD